MSKASSTLMVLLLLLAGVSPAMAAKSRYYKWMDADGGLHFADGADKIPPQYRNQIQIIEDKTPPPPAHPAGAEAYSIGTLGRGSPATPSGSTGISGTRPDDLIQSAVSGNDSRFDDPDSSQIYYGGGWGMGRGWWSPFYFMGGCMPNFTGGVPPGYTGIVGVNDPRFTLGVNDPRTVFCNNSQPNRNGRERWQHGQGGNTSTIQARNNPSPTGIATFSPHPGAKGIIGVGGTSRAAGSAGSSRGGGGGIGRR